MLDWKIKVDSAGNLFFIGELAGIEILTVIPSKKRAFYYEIVACVADCSWGEGRLFSDITSARTAAEKTAHNLVSSKKAKAMTARSPVNACVHNSAA